MAKILAALLLSTAVFTGSASQAQELPLTGLNRTELKRADLNGAPGTEVIMAILEVPPGATLPRHFHHGDEVFYVLEGATVQAPGQQPVTLQIGGSGYNVRNVPHAGIQVVSDRPLKLLTVHVVDKGKPLFAEVKPTQ